MIGPSDRRTTWIAPGLVTLWLFHSAANLIWLKIDTRPPFWDMAGHTMTAIRMARLPFLTDFPAALQSLLATSGYPPLVYLLSAPLTLFFWPTADVVTGMNTLFVGILILSTYSIARAWRGVWTGLLAAFLVSMYPILYGLARYYLLEVPLVAMVTLSVWMLIRTASFERRGASILCGLALGLGMLTKWTCAVFVAGPFLVVTARALRACSRRRLINLALTVAIAALAAAPWYWVNLPVFASVAKAATTYGLGEGDPTLGSLWSWTWYLESLVNEQVLLPFTLVFVVGMMMLLAKRWLPYETLLLLCWIAVPYVAFSSFVQKDDRFTMPYLPAMAVITALGLSQFRRKLQAALIVCLVLYSVLQFTGLSWGLSHRLPVGWLLPRVTVRVGPQPIRLYAEGIHIASPPQTGDWQTQTIFHDILRLDGKMDRTRPLVLTVLPDAPCFEANVFAYYALSERYAIQVQSVVGPYQVADVQQRVLNSDYVVAKTGAQGPSYTTRDAKPVTDEIHDPSSELGRRFELMGTYPLPDGSVGELYRRKRT